MKEPEPPQPIRWSDYTLTAEQEIRARAVEAAVKMYPQTANANSGYILRLATDFAHYIETGER